MRTADVSVHGLFAGTLTHGDGEFSFRLHESYIDTTDRPVLSQWFEDDLSKVYRGSRGRLPAFFANLIPDGELREVLERSLNLASGDDLALLEAVGLDLPGAVQVVASADGAEIETAG
jgi:serine/threonine-protein kinase HipA